MNGTMYDEIKKKGHSKKREKLKMAVALISSNLLVGLLCLQFGSSAPVTSNSISKSRILHPHYKMIVVPLTVLIDLDPSATETAVSLMTKSKKILISRAYLHEEVKDANRPSEGPSRFKIEIPESEVLKLSADAEVEMIAIPELKLNPVIKKTINKRVSHYEIDL